MSSASPQNPKRKRGTSDGAQWAVVGGGLMGLTISLRLAQAGYGGTILEASPEIGGLAAAWTLNGVTWDKHYHVTLLSDRWTRGLLNELGLEPQMRWVVTRTGFFAGGRLSPMSNAIDYLRLPALGMVAKLRLAATILYASRLRDWRRLERIPVEVWLRRCSGNQAFERIWRPLLQAKLGEGYRDASAAFIWATIQRLYAARRTGLKREMFGYVPGGYARILARFAEHLEHFGVRVKTGCAVQRIRRSGGRLTVSTDDGEEMFDGVVVTTSPSLAARICVDLTDAERTQLRSVKYQGVVCAALLLDRPLSDSYLTYLADADLPITAIVDMSAFVDPAQFEGRGLVYLPRYVHASEAIFSESDARIEDRFVKALRRVYPDLERGQVCCCRISRVREVFPIPTLDYSTRLPSPTTSVPGLHLVSSAHIINGTLNVNDTVRVAEQAARSLIQTDGMRIELGEEGSS